MAASLWKKDREATVKTTKQESTERQIMKTQRSSILRWQVVYSFVAGVVILSHTASAQQNIGGGARGPRGGVAGLGPQGGVAFGSQAELGALLMKGCDAERDGAVTPAKLKAAVQTWFERADADKDGALSQIEIAAALKQVFPPPQLPPGVPAPPEDFALHIRLAKNLMAAIDANKDGKATLQEANAYVTRSFGRWDDRERNGSLDATELASAFDHLVGGQTP